ncbi:Gfo/Idh/MocA family oxidoreductase [Cyclobacterium sp. SYSU L10401]|uniref:Gfo/Idh/MocA family oxidoreductase n=1 Tax=Cyclobacterium sp. SYSU L10401 TaxID=2678657 RepID=UPI0013D24C16|nr:Gfo/Idh/MocA family oxidoreductase [Cyclobacterium sp. SYSU L10401]
MIKIGIIGMSPGNAHPYSWSAIINGTFDGKEIAALGYPAVSDYLMANKDTLGLPNARVTHVWCQEKAISKSIAKSSQIDQVVERLEDMIGQVDAVILARDDPENHVAMAKAFLEADIPIFIDKPLAFSKADLQYFSSQHRSGKFLMSCSSMRYAHECRTIKTEIKSLGQLHLVTAVGKKDWKKYGVHLLEALFATLDDPTPLWVQHVGEKDKDIVVIGFQHGLKATVHLFKDISGTFQLSFFGSEGWRIAEIKNSYAMFRDNLIEFIRSVEEGASRLEFEKTGAIIRTVIGAWESYENDGRVISLK